MQFTHLAASLVFLMTAGPFVDGSAGSIAPTPAGRVDGVPEAFMPARFAGYTLNPGDTVRVDEDGIPRVIIWSTGTFNYNPTTVAQWGLGAYARAEFETARKASDWLIQNQSANGGFPLTFDHAIPGGYSVTAPWYSAISQGNAISLLVRMWKVDRNPSYLRSAKRALRLLAVPVAAGGLQGELNGGIWFEMVADPRYPNHIFNGSVFALLGVHDLAVIGDDAEAQALWRAGEASLRANLSAFTVRAPFHPDAPPGLPDRWALYDLQVNGFPAVPNYIGESYMLVQCELMDEMARRTHYQDYAQLAKIWRHSLTLHTEPKA